MELARDQLPVLSRFARLAGGHGIGGGLLSGYANLSAQRNLWNDSANSSISRIDPRQRGRGPRSREYRLVHPVSADRARFHKGARDSSSSCTSRRVLGIGHTRTAAEPKRRSRENASIAHSGLAAEGGRAVTFCYSPFAIRYSLFSHALAKRRALSRLAFA